MSDRTPKFWANKAGDSVAVCMGSRRNPTLIWYGEPIDQERAEDLARLLNRAVEAVLVRKDANA